jgi:hypothetical protein
MNWFKRKQQQKEITTSVKDAQTGTTIPLTHIFTDSLQRKWYQFDNHLTIPAKRAIAAEVATKMQEMNLTKEVLLQLMAKMKDHANSGKIVELFSILNEIEFRLNFIAEEETLISLAACYFVLEGEDETNFNEVEKKKKVDFIKSDKQAFNFFVQRAFEYTTKYSQMSDIDIQEYLTLNAHNAERVNHYLRILK